MDLKTTLIYGYQAARSTQFAGQQLTLPFFERLATGRSSGQQIENLQEKRMLILAELRRLLKEDSANIAKGLYPVDVLWPESPIQHWRRYGRILVDGWSLARRRNAKEAHDFDHKLDDEMSEAPDYYKRNFHFQTGGYFTEGSADLYEHQVEILFAGGGDAMRRALIPLFKNKFSGDGDGLHFLEIAGGTGCLSRFMKLAYPKARVTVSDLSWAYLKKAREKLSDFDRIEFVRAAAESLPFRDEMFDGVFSCFLFHELPRDIRGQAVREGFRVLRPGGAYGIVDSLQMNEAGPFAWALERFPIDFHEPFFKDYTQNALEDLLADQKFIRLQKKIAFLGKALLTEKPS